MKAHKYWSLGALAAMIGTFYTGYKNMKTAHKYFAFLYVYKFQHLVCLCQKSYCRIHNRIFCP